METTATGSFTARSVGELCIGGDWAWAHGDFGALRYIAQQLAIGFGEPIHCDLTKLADLCLCDLDAAGTLWAQLKDQLYRSTRHDGGAGGSNPCSGGLS